VAFLKNRTSSLIFGGVIVLALIGIFGMLFKNPTQFLQGIAVILLIGIAIYFIIRLIYRGNPQKKEQRAFLKAAKQSKKRLQRKGVNTHSKTSSLGMLTTLKRPAKRKRNTTAHLTVIDGKKGKKKNRASF
jgi:ABC-type nickel/cobalt efflux system permease component RcnA